MRLRHLKSKLLMPYHFLQDLCYCCPPTSTPKKPAVALLFFFHLCYTSYKETGFHFLLLRLHDSTLLTCHYLFLSCYQSSTLEDILLSTHSLSKKKKLKNSLWELSINSWPNTTVVLNRDIFSGTQTEHLWSGRLNISDQDMETSCYPSHQAVSPQPVKLLKTFYLLSPALLQDTKL